jgi:polysaccharide transporter, PST family
VRLAAGPGFEGAVGTLRVLVLILPLVAASQVMGLQLMTALRMDRRFVLTVAVGGVTTAAAALVLAPVRGGEGVAWARVTGEAAVVLAGLACLRPHWRALFPKTEARDAPAV